VLLIDGHSSHIDIEASKLCRDNNILLYCLPPHSSHITQPLDVGFYGPLKASWRKAVAKYALDHVGYSVTKYTFAEVFKEAWIATVKMSTIVNASHHAGIWPVNPNVCKSKVAPATLYCASEKVGKDNSKVSDEQSKVHVGLQVLESALSGTTKKIFKSRYEEGYDVKDDELCSKLNELKLDGGKDNLEPTSKSKQYAAADSSQEVNEAFKQALVIPDQVPHKKTLRGS